MAGMNDLDDDDNAECPVPCASCKRIVDLHDCYHHPKCYQCRPEWRRPMCDNLICKTCYYEVEEDDDEAIS